jgi:hypothetical protein
MWPCVGGALPMPRASQRPPLFRRSRRLDRAIENQLGDGGVRFGAVPVVGWRWQMLPGAVATRLGPIGQLDQANHRLTVIGDDHLFTIERRLHQLRKLILGVEHVDLHGASRRYEARF